MIALAHDLEIRCTTCDRVPATLRINGSTLCRTCALALIDRVSPPPPAPVPVRTRDELRLEFLACVRANTDRPITTEKARKVVGVRFELATEILESLASEVLIARSYVGMRCLGWATPERAVPQSAPHVAAPVLALA